MEKMNIISAKYYGHESLGITIHAVIDGQEICVPLDPNNRHYAEILRQVEAGELTIQEADA